MWEKLAAVDERYNELESLMADPAVAADYTRVAEYAQERSEIEPLVTTYRELGRVEQELADAQTMREDESSSEMRELVEEEIFDLRARREKLTGQILSMLRPTCTVCTLVTQKSAAGKQICSAATIRGSAALRKSSSRCAAAALSLASNTKAACTGSSASRLPSPRDAFIPLPLLLLSCPKWMT